MYVCMCNNSYFGLVKSLISIPASQVLARHSETESIKVINQINKKPITASQLNHHTIKLFLIPAYTSSFTVVFQKQPQ